MHAFLPLVVTLVPIYPLDASSPLHSLISYYSLLRTPLTPCRFMSPLNECEEEPDADAFEWSGEGRTLAKEDLRAMIYSEIREIHPACPAGR